MKKYFNICILSLLAILVFQACNKYEEGPFISLRSAEKRIAGDYQVEKYLINGQLISLDELGITEYRMVYNADGTGTSYITINSGTQETNFKWELDEKKLRIRESFKGQNDEWSAWSDYKTILKLTDTEFWIKDGNELESQEFHFVE
jgi:hypothetical protein